MLLQEDRECSLGKATHMADSVEALATLRTSHGLCHNVLTVGASSDEVTSALQNTAQFTHRRVQGRIIKVLDHLGHHDKVERAGIERDAGARSCLEAIRDYCDSC